jgi:hypothetical protein
MNWYAYCGNNPVNYVDPRGLFPTGESPLIASVAFYNPDATGYYTDPEGHVQSNTSGYQFQEQADDANYCVAMHYRFDVIDWLYKHEELRKADPLNIPLITEIYFFDHSYTLGQSSTQALGFGEDKLNFADNKLRWFCEDINKYTSDDTVIHFRQCCIDPCSQLNKLANWTQRKVTGCAGAVMANKDVPWAYYDPNYEEAGPEYYFDGDLYECMPGQKYPTKIWYPGMKRKAGFVSGGMCGGGYIIYEPAPQPY